MASKAESDAPAIGHGVEIPIVEGRTLRCRVCACLAARTIRLATERQSEVPPAFTEGGPVQPVGEAEPAQPLPEAEQIPYFGATAPVQPLAEAGSEQSVQSVRHRPLEEAAVLVGLVERPSAWTVLLTERAQNLPQHAGQVGFPGGRFAAPGEGAVAAALREAREEVGLESEDVAVAGCLAPYMTRTGFRVTPIVGFVSGRFEPRPDPGEVAAVFEVPLALILTPNAYSYLSREVLGRRVKVYELRFEGHRIWGATAAILHSFMELLSDGEANR